MTTRSQQPWSPEDDDLLRLHYATMRTEELAALLQRGVPAVYHHATKKLGLSKPQIFKPGLTTPRAAAVGTVRRGGRHKYLYVKVIDGAWPHAWRLQHYLNWEAVNGPVPDGHVLTFKDGNREHTDASNLELVTKADWIKRYQVEANLPPEVAQLVRLKGALTRAINRRDKEQNDAA